MIVGAAMCPAAPLLLPGVTGAADSGAGLRVACRDAVGALLATSPDSVHVVGTDGSAVTPHSYAPLLAPAGPDRPRPLSALVAGTLLDACGWRGTREVLLVDAAHPTDACARTGARLAGAPGRAGLLVVGDGSARRGVTAPGYLDERARAFDERVVHAVRTADAGTLLRLEPGLAHQLMVGGRAPWQVLAGALEATGPVTSDVLYVDDPFGVLYLVAVLTPAAP